MTPLLGVLVAVVNWLAGPLVVIDTTTATAFVHSPTGTASMNVVVGATGWETPTGVWRVTGIYHPGPASPYGPLALTTNAPPPNGFEAVALHGTNRPALLSRSDRHLSHGCIRFSNEQIVQLTELYGIGVDTPVIIINTETDGN